MRSIAWKASWSQSTCEHDKTMRSCRSVWRLSHGPVQHLLRFFPTGQLGHDPIYWVTLDPRAHKLPVEIFSCGRYARMRLLLHSLRGFSLRELFLCFMMNARSCSRVLAPARVISPRVMSRLSCLCWGVLSFSSCSVRGFFARGGNGHPFTAPLMPLYCPFENTHR